MSNTKVVTTEVRFSYCHVFKPTAIEEGQTPKYSVSILIDKGDTALLEQVKSAIKAAYEAGVASKFGGKKPTKGTWKNPLRDGDVERPDNEEYEGMWFLNASSTTAPGVIDTKGKPLTSDDFYSGCYGKASINFYAFNKAGNKGIACGLNNLLKLRDGDALGAEKASATSDFGITSEAEDDFM